MRGLTKLAVIGTAVAVFQFDVGPVVTTANAQSPGWCQGLSSRYVNAVNRARRKGCRVNRAISRARYYRTCLGNRPGVTLRNLQQWQRYAQTCRGGAVGGGRRQFCSNRANQIAGAVNRARNRGCNTSTGWNYTRYFNWCLRSPNSAVNNQLARWNNYARTCRGTGSGSNRGVYCRGQANRYMALINQARRKRCNVSTAWGLNRFYTWCLGRNNSSVTSNINQWARYAQTCRGAAVQCPAIFRPVCGIRFGRRQTYSNACVARRSGARIVAQGRCRAGGTPGGGQAAKRRACNAYASRVMGQVAAWRGRGCPTGAPIWNPNRTVHFNLCMSGGQAAMSQQSRARANDLAQGCSRN